MSAEMQIYRRRNGWSIAADALTVLISVIWLLPLIASVFMSLRPASRPLSQDTLLWALTAADERGIFLPWFTLENYERALLIAPWGSHYLSSIIFVVGTLVVQWFTVTFAGYAFARMRFVGRDLLLYLILLQLMIPAGVLLVQNFATIRQLGLYDTHIAMMIPYWASAFGTLLMRQAFREVPIELEEAARIDGANLFQILWRVYIPLSIPSLLAFSIVSVSSHWNELLWPLIITRSPEVRPLTVGLNQLFTTSDTGAAYGLLMAGTLMVISPLIVLFVLFQKQFINSFASSGLK
ncbi:carbohydrate ABC transporter permease [Aggregatilineales bacterium SYSU G02658]